MISCRLRPYWAHGAGLANGALIVDLHRYRPRSAGHAHRGEEAAETFYREVLGFNVVPKPPALAGRGGRWFEQGGVRVHLGVEADFRPARKAHPALVVAPFEDLLERLATAGVELQWSDEGPGVRRGHVHDCFGNRLELVDPGPDQMALDSCAECGFEYDLEQSGLAGASIVEGSLRIGAVLSDPGADVKRRRSPAQWSPLEYGCHVRDVLLVQRERVLLARREACPSLTPMGRDERVEHDGYSEQVPADVARQLEESARLFANVLARLGDRDWDRTLIYNYPEPTERSLRWVAIHTLHEVIHHRMDVARQLEVTGDSATWTAPEPGRGPS